MSHLYEIKRAAYNSNSYTKFLLQKNNNILSKLANNYTKKK